MNGEEWTTEYLEHHGVKGMRWGVVKERRAQRQAKKQVKREGRAQKYVSKAEGFQKNIEKANERTGFKSIGKNRTIIRNYNKKQQALADAQRKREGKLTDRQRKIAIGAGVAVTILAAYGTYHSLNSGNARRLVTKGKMFVKGNKGAHPWNINHDLASKNLDADQVLSKVVSHVNPGYGKAGTKMNCRRATFAYEMRRRGYDVAATKTPTGMGQDITGLFNATKRSKNNVPPGISGVFTRTITEGTSAARKGTATPFDDFTKVTSNFGKIKLDPRGVTDHLSKMPIGARGELGVKWMGGGGHSVAWERFKDGVTVFDNQTGQKYSGDSLKELLSSVSETGVTRLDNLPLDKDFLLRWVKNA